MPRQAVESYIAYPAIVPYPMFRFVGFALKWSIILVCAASIPYTLFNCYRVIEKVAKNPTSVHSAGLPRPAHASPRKGQRP